MQEFLQIILSFPTALYTLLLSAALLYWVFVILGALDLDIFHLDADLDVDVDLELGADLHMHAHVDSPSADGAESGHGGDASALVWLLSSLGWTGVPITITLSVFLLFNWVLTYLGVWMWGSYGMLAEVGVFLASLMVSAPAASLCVRPLRKTFVVQRRVGGDNLIGQTVRIMSGSVDAQRGNAQLDDGAIRLDISVRADVPNGLERGMEALIIGYDDARHVYFVEPMGVIFGLPSTQPGHSSAVPQHAEQSQSGE